MSSVTVPDLLSFSLLSRNISDLKSQADAARTEAVTGQYEDVTEALKGDVGSAHLLKKAVDDVKLFQEILSLAEGRAQTTQTTLNSLHVQSSRIATETVAAVGRNDAEALDVNAADARTEIFNIFGLLNTNFGGRALFGGDVTDRAPLAPPEQLLADIEAIMASAIDAADADAQLDFYFNDPGGGFATSIYQGGANKAPAVEIAPGIRIDASAKADDQPIKDLIRGLATIAAAEFAIFPPAPVFSDGAQYALDAEKEMTELRADIGVSQTRISAAKTRYEAEETVLANLFNEKTARDPFEAASELNLLESQLEASYLLTARLARLTIADYLG